MSTETICLMLKLAAAGLLAVAAGVSAYGVARMQRPPGSDQVARYIVFLDDLYARCFVDGSGRKTLKIQAGLVAAILGIAVLAAEPLLISLAIPVLVTPALRLLRLRKRRSAACDSQAGQFCLALANLLRTIPNIQTALDASVLATKAPLSAEIRLALAEVALGNPLDVALLNAAARTKSRSFDAGVSALLVGYQVGGNVPKLLETTSATLREMDRLDGVVRSKTAEGRAQLGVLAVLPAAILFSFNLASPGYFAPLQEQWVGRIVLAAATVLWLSSLFLAKAILVVDI